MTGTVGGTAGGREERDWARDRSLHQPWTRHPPPPRSKRLLSPTCSGRRGGVSRSKVCTKRRPTAGRRVVCGASARPSPARRPAGTHSPQTGLSLSRGHGICSPSPPRPWRPSGTGEACESRGPLHWLPGGDRALAVPHEETGAEAGEPWSSPRPLGGPGGVTEGRAGVWLGGVGRVW